MSTTPVDSTTTKTFSFLLNITLPKIVMIVLGALLIVGVILGKIYKVNAVATYSMGGVGLFFLIVPFVMNLKTEWIKSKLSKQKSSAASILEIDIELLKKKKQELELEVNVLENDKVKLEEEIKNYNENLLNLNNKLYNIRVAKKLGALQGLNMSNVTYYLHVN